MLPGPLFSIELLTSPRRTRYFVIRVLYAVALLAMLVIVGLNSEAFRSFPFRQRPVSEIAAVANLMASFFHGFAWVQMLAVVLFGPGLVAGTISTERERRTIEYLFASPLSNTEIVLGKLAGRLLHVIYLVLTGMPILALAMLMGGIAPEAIALLLVMTVSTAVTVAAISIAISVWSRRAREAVSRAYLALMALVIVPPIICGMSLPLSGSGLARVVAWIEPVNEQLLVANPFWVLNSALEGVSSSNMTNGWEIAGLLVRNQLLLAAVAVVGATLAVRRVHLRASGAAPRKRLRWMQRWRPGVGQWPMLWKEVYAEPAASRLGWIGRIAVGVVVLAILVPPPAIFFSMATTTSIRDAQEAYIGYTMFVGGLLACGSLLLVASRAAGSISSEKERQCWDSLLGTPLEAREILVAKILGSVWALRAVPVLVGLLWIPAICFSPTFAWVALFEAGTVAVLALFGSTLGVMYSLNARTSLRAMAATLATCLFVGGGYMIFFACCMPFMRGGPDGLEIVFAPCVPFLLALPCILYEQGSHNSDPAMGGVVVAYVLGVVGYAGAAAVLFGSMLNSFDRVTGRTVDRMRGLAQSLIVAEFVDEKSKAAKEP